MPPEKHGATGARASMGRPDESLTSSRTGALKARPSSRWGAAGELLVESGLSDRVQRLVMDFTQAGVDVDPADVVVMNRVICCYPDMPKLAGAAADRARVMLVMSFPNRRWWTRLGLTLANFGFRVIRLQLRVLFFLSVLVLFAIVVRGIYQWF